ncbi:MAG: hypothetical protein IMX02_06525 [Limnochordaceae bacterium]|nr:hypothetical protein [Limnochordaceae bacterium]
MHPWCARACLLWLACKKVKPALLAAYLAIIGVLVRDALSHALPLGPVAPGEQAEIGPEQLAASQPEQPSAGGFSPSLRASGESLWNVRLAWGDVAGLLGQEGYAAGQATFQQQLRLRLEGDVAPGAKVSSDLDNVRSENLQLIGIDFTWGPATAHLGDVRLRSESRYAAGPATLKGLSVEARWGAWELGALAGRARGIPATKTFYGPNSEDTTRWVPAAPPAFSPSYAPTREGAALVADARGAQGFRLARAFEPDFMKVWLIPSDSAPAAGCGETRDGRSSLKQLLDDFGLGYLVDAGPGSTPRGVLKPQPYAPPSQLPPPGLSTEDVARAFFPLDSGRFTAVANPEGTSPRGYVLLQLETLDLLRSHVELLIERYNELNRLSGAGRRTYPFVRGSDLERQFLSLLRQYYRIEAGAGDYPGASGWSSAMAPLSGTGASGPVGASWLGTCPDYREYLGTGTANLEVAPDGTFDRSKAPDPARTPASVLYLTGNAALQQDSLVVEVERPEGSVEPADTYGFSWMVFPEQGVLKVAFPATIGGAPGTIEALARSFRALQARYRYRVSGGIYALGTSVAAGSEEVRLNGQQLRRDVDYTIDYETGVLVLLRDAGPADTIEVRFEYFRGGPGATTEYNRNVLGVRAGWKPGDAWRVAGELLFAGDEPRPLVAPDRARTMPNSHTVAALVGGYRAWQGVRPEQGFWAELDTAWSHDVFPFDDNVREPQANEVQAIAGGVSGGGWGGYVLLGHRAGLTVGALDAAGQVMQGTWRRYDTGAGLSGTNVLAVAGAARGTVSDGSLGDPVGPVEAWLLGTESGLTAVVDAGQGPASFEKATSYLRRYASGGLPSNEVRDVLYVGVVPPPASRVAHGPADKPSVWVATARGLAWAGAGEWNATSLGDWHGLDAAALPPWPEGGFRSLAFAPVGPHDPGAPPAAAALLAAGPGGVLWIPLWGLEEGWGARHPPPFRGPAGRQGSGGLSGLLARLHARAARAHLRRGRSRVGVARRRPGGRAHRRGRAGEHGQLASRRGGR